MNKERLRRKHDTTPRPYLCKFNRPFKGPFKEEGQSSSPREKIDKDRQECLSLQCAGAPKTHRPVNVQDCGYQTLTFSDNEERKNMSDVKIKEEKNDEIKVLQDYNLKMLTNPLAIDPYFAYGQYIASELRKYDSQTLAHCKKDFADVLFDADIETLNRSYPCWRVPSNGNVPYKLNILPSHLTTDPYFAYGHYIASELRKYDQQMLAHVKKAFSEVLFEADSGTLLSSCHSRNLKHAANVKQENEEYERPTTSSSHNKIDFQNREEWKDLIPVDNEPSTNIFQSTDEEVNSSWEDILSDSSPYTSEENDSSEETIDINAERAEYSSPEIMRLEGSKFSEEIISPLECLRKTIDLQESDLNFSPKLASTQVEYSLENSRDFDRSVHKSPNLENFIEPGIDLSPKLPTTPIESSFGNRRIFDRFFHQSTKLGNPLLEIENSLPSTIKAPSIFDFEEVQKEKDALVIETTPTGFENVLNVFRNGVEKSEKSFLTTIKTEDVVDSVFKHPDEPESTDLDAALLTGGGSDEQHTLVTNERRSLNENLINTPTTGKIYTRKFFLSDSSNLWSSGRRLNKGRQRENVSPRQLFIHSKLSSGELNTSIIRQSSRKNSGKRKIKKNNTRLIPPNPPKATNYSGTSNQDPYILTSDGSDLNTKISIPSPSNSYWSVAGNLKARKKTPAVKSRRKIKESLRSSKNWKPLSKKEVQEYAEYLKTIPICPLGLRNSRYERMNEDISSDEI